MPLARSWMVVAALGLAAGPAARAQQPTAGREFPAARDQGPVHEAWTQRDLVPGAQVNAAVQADDGYLWLATTVGLLRFDGARATRMDPPALDSLPSRSVLSLLKARDGAIWAGTAHGGLFRLAGDTVTHWTTAQGLPSNLVPALFQDSTGTMWVGTASGLCRMDAGRCRRVGPPGFRALALGTDWSGRLLVGSYGLFRLVGDSLAALPVLTPTLYRVTRITRGRGGVVWVSTVAGLVRLSAPPAPGAPPGVRSFTTRDGLPSNYVLTALAGGGDTLWVGTLGGGLALRHDGRFLTIDERQGLTDDRVNYLTRDRDGNLWASTSGGLDRFHARAITTFTRADGLPDPLVWAVAGDGHGTLWLSTNAGGLTRFAGGRFTTWNNHPAIATSRISVIAPVADGSVWLGVRPRIVVRFHDGRVDDWSARPGAPRGNVVAITQSPDGDLYFGGTTGLVRLHAGAFSTVALPGDSAARAIRVLALAPDGTLWAGGNSLYRVRRGRAELVGDPGAFTANAITALLPDSGRLWISTDGTGLRLLRDNRLTSLAHAGTDMLTEAFTLLDDGHGSIWLASSSGLERVEKRELLAAAAGRLATIPVRRLDKSDGLLSTEFNSAGASSGWRTPDGRLWFAGAHGLVAVNPDVILPPAAPPPARIERVVADGRALSARSELTLPKGTRQIVIDFTSLQFRSPRHIRFRYRLLGLDTVWQNVGTRRSAFYSSLPGGTYTFQVSARDDAGDWNTQPAQLSLHALPPFTQTLWFFLLLGVVTIGATAGALSLRERALRRQARRLESQVAERTRDLKDEVATRERAEDALREARDHLERRVIDRTADLGHAIDALRLNQERLDLLVRQLPAVVWSTDPQQRIVTAVGSGLSAIGLDPDELVGRSFDDVLDDPDLRRGFRLAHHRALRGEPTQERGTYRDRTFEWRVEPARDAHGLVTGAIGLALDVTDQARLREEILQAQKMESIGRLAGGVAHDLNNLLTAVLGFVDLSASAKTREELLESLDEIRFASERAASLTRQLLTFARRQKTSVGPVDVGATLRGVDGLVRRLLGSGITLHTDVDAGAPPVLADPHQLEQVIVNLAVNARDAMPDGGRLTITLRTRDIERPRGDLAAGPYVVLTVIDTGVGMPEEVKARVFEPFFTTKELGKGTGLGLSTSFGIVREFHGAIEIASAPGEGTTVSVYLPAHARPTPAVRVPPQAPAGNGAATILLVEDEAPVRELACRALESFGYRVLTAADGREGIDVAAAHDGPIHLLLTDVRMPRLSGLDLAAQLMTARPELRVLVMSGYADFTPPLDAPQLADVPRLMKPFRITELAERVRQLLAGQPPFGT